MRRWEPEKKSPLPNPKGPYLEFEAARFWGYTLGAWKQESVVNQAMVIAHYLNHSMREAYSFEISSKGGKGKGNTVASVFGPMMKRLDLPPE